VQGGVPSALRLTETRLGGARSQRLRIALSKVCRTLLERGKIKAEDVLAISVMSQRDTCVFLGKDGKPLRPAILWLDQRMAKYDIKLSLHFKIGFKLVEMEKATVISAKKRKANWVRQNEPEIWKNTHKFLLLSGWFNYLLSGEFVDMMFRIKNPSHLR